MRRGFEDGLFEEDLEDALPPLIDDDRGFLDRLDVGAGDDEDEKCVEVVGEAAWDCCGVLALGMSTQTSDSAERYLDPKDTAIALFNTCLL